MDDSRRDLGLNGLSAQEITRLCADNVISTLPERLFFKDLESRFVLVTSGWAKSFGAHHPAEEIRGKTDADFFSPEHAASARAEDQRVIKSGEWRGPRLMRLDQDGARTWTRVSKGPLLDGGGNVVGVWGVTHDVTAELEAEQEVRESREELQASETMHRALFEQNPHPTCIYDKGTLQVIAVNRATVETYGYSREECLAMTIMDVIPPADLGRFQGAAKPWQAQEEAGLRDAHPQRHLRKDGTIIEVEVTTSDVTLNGRACRVASIEDVTERNRAAAEIVSARDQAVEASNMKSAFLATISHEIRTPMNGVLGMNELLLDTRLDDQQRMLADQVARSGELMLALINDILDISRIEAGRLELDVVDYDLHEAIAQACRVAGVQAGAKGLEFVVRISDDVPEQARGDGRRLGQVLMNIVSNAVKFTSQGVVAVDARVLEDGTERTLRIEVSDSGIGIDAAILEQMFQPFTQADVSTTRNFGGTGLGLAIARELIELMGGTIGAQADPAGGSMFWIELVLAAPIDGNEDLPAEDRDGPAAVPAWLTAPLVLVAEDSPVNQIVATRALERCGCVVEVASDGREALEMLAARHYDAVLMDCQMPGMDGYQATAELRARENGGPRMPVIAMTARAMEGDRLRCLAAGMDDYITKPIRREQLTETLQRLIAA